MGLDVHDVGGYLPGEGKKNLRLWRELEPGMVCGKSVEARLVIVMNVT